MTSGAVVVGVLLVALAHSRIVAARHTHNRTEVVTRPHGEFECLDSADCDQDHCCVISPIRYSYPMCSAHGQKGATCRPTAVPFNTTLGYPDGLVAHVANVHYIMCACARGLQCSEGTCLETQSPGDHNSLEED